jgi:hypothetical protein
LPIETLSIGSVAHSDLADATPVTTSHDAGGERQRWPPTADVRFYRSAGHNPTSAERLDLSLNQTLPTPVI